jgi:hypothetical protein
MLIFVAIIAVVITIFFTCVSQKNKNEEIAQNVDNRASAAAPDFKYKCDYQDDSNFFRISYVVKNDCQSVVFVYSYGEANKINVREIKMSEIVDVQVDCDGEVQGGVGRAVVGGLLAGGVGAIVGASTAKKQITYFDIMLTCRSISDPVLLFRLIKSPVSTSSEQYKQALDFSRKVSASIKALMEMEAESKKTDEEK